MQRRVSLEDDAGRTPRRLLVKVAEPGARRGAESLPVRQRRMHLLVASHGPALVTVQPDNRPCLAQLFVERIGIAEELGRERVQF
jgi:hypothetical protein